MKKSKGYLVKARTIKKIILLLIITTLLVTCSCSRDYTAGNITKYDYATIKLKKAEEERKSLIPHYILSFAMIFIGTTIYADRHQRGIIDCTYYFSRTLMISGFFFLGITAFVDGFVVHYGQF